MKVNAIKHKPMPRLVLSALILFASNLTCAYFPGSTSIQPTPNLVPQFTPASKLTPTKSQNPKLSPSSTNLPIATLSLPSTKKSALPPVVASPVPKLTVIPAEDLIWEMIRRVDIERALNDLRQFTGEMPLCIDTECRTITDRETGSEGLSRAKEYVYNQLVNLGYSVAIRDWSREGWTDQNIIASKPGLVSPDEEIYFVAHMDGVLPAGVIRSPAADDNASGTVDLLETARILSRYTFNRTLVLLFSTGEEQGVEGVQSYVDQLSQADISAIKYVVNVDMVGYDSDHDGVMQLWAGDHQPSLMFAQKLRDIILSYQLNLVPRVVTGCT